MKPSYALSIRQPWAWLIVNGHKLWENRSWGEKNPALRFLKSRLPLRFYVHAPAGMTLEEYESAQEIAFEEGVTLPAFGELKRAGIVGEATAIEWRDEGDPNVPFSFCSGIVLRDAREAEYVPCKGSLGFFIPEINDELRFVPFPNGTSFTTWYESNCDRCWKAKVNESTGKSRCGIENAIALASVSDGAVKPGIARRLNWDGKSYLETHCPEREEKRPPQSHRTKKTAEGQTELPL